MRKILLATTAIVALSAGSAMAADITISGSFEFGYNDDSTNTGTNAAGAAGGQLTNGDGTSYGVEQDVNINMTSTTKQTKAPSRPQASCKSCHLVYSS